MLIEVSPNGAWGLAHGMFDVRPWNSGVDKNIHAGTIVGFYLTKDVKAPDEFVWRKRTRPQIGHLFAIGKIAKTYEEWYDLAAIFWLAVPFDILWSPGTRLPEIMVLRMSHHDYHRLKDQQLWVKRS